MSENLYKNEKGSVKIKKYEILYKEDLNSFLLNCDESELNSLNLFNSDVNKTVIKEKMESLLSDEKFHLFLLLDDNELIGLYFLNSDSYISFIIKKEQRNKGYGKIGLHILIQELSINYPEISHYNFKIKKDNINALLIVYGNNAIECNESDDAEIILKIEKNNKIWIHEVNIDDLQEVMKITDSAKQLLKKNGSLQWQQGYPDENTFKNDIKNKALIGLYEHNQLKAFGAYIYGKDLNYVDIEGKWDIPANDRDMAIHRVAVDENSHGKKYGIKILKYGIIYAKKLKCLTVKVDTHKNNIPMQKSILRSGFIYKGIIKILTEKLDNLRYAYEIVL